MFRIILLIVRAAAIPLCVSMLFAQTPELTRHFNYDRNTPLDIQKVSAEKRGDIVIQDISYASPKSGPS